MSLQTLLKQMYEDGIQRDKVAQKRKLTQGLHISLTCHSSGVTLIISRDKVYPSMKEWNTCLANFPYYTGKVPFTQIIDSDKRFALRGEIPDRRTVAEQMRLDMTSQNADAPVLFQQPELAKALANTMTARKAVLEISGGARNAAGKTNCPICQYGTITYFIANNGHTRGKCSTDECVEWIE